MGTMCAGCRKAITSSRPTLESHTLVLDSESVRTPLLRFCLESNEPGDGSRSSQKMAWLLCVIFYSLCLKEILCRL